MSNSIMVKMWPDGDCVAMTTYDRRHGRNGRFLFIKDTLSEWLAGGGESALMDTDCGNIAQLCTAGQTVRIQVWWLSAYGRDEVRGFTQRFELPLELLQALLSDETPIKHLYATKQQTSHVVTVHASETIRQACADKLSRHALSKAMRDCFWWPGETVTLYRDGCKSFFFRTASGCPSCGGLILHETIIHTLAGDRPRLRYCVHT